MDQKCALQFNKTKVVWKKAFPFNIQSNSIENAAKVHQSMLMKKSI